VTGWHVNRYTTGPDTEGCAPFSHPILLALEQAVNRRGPPRGLPI
jgi:hypothetical protein